MMPLKKPASSPSTWKVLFSGVMVFIVGLCLIAISIGLSGCNAIEEDSSGDLTIGLTDSEGDFIRYKVDVLSLTLTQANGVVVDTLPMYTEVDFAQYTEMTEFLTAATIPSGLYTKATLSLDYQNADIWYEDPNGKAVQIDTVVDEDENSFETLEVPVHLESSDALLILPGIPAHLTLDFNLSASNKVHETDSNVLIVQPVMVADVNPQSPKIHRLRGPLKEVDPDEGTILIIIRPFVHAISGGDERFGVLRVITNSNTIYAINGNFYQGQTGLDAMDAMPVFTATVVIGDLKFNPRRFEAREVRAGSSVAGGTLDVVTGNVTSRDPNTLMVKGATLIRSDSSILFNDSVTIHLDANTRVARQFSLSLQDTNDISVGQRVTAFGTLDPNTTDPELNGDLVFLQLTTLRGTVVSVDTNQIDIRLQTIDGRRASIFDFQGTGMDAGNDADPNHYEIDTGTLDISSLQTGKSIKVLGFVNTFGQAPEDFIAHTYIDVSQIPALMTVGWFPADPNAFEDISTNNLTLDLQGTGLFHHVGRAGVIIDLTGLSNPPSIQPAGAMGFFSISENLTRQLHTSFENFVTDLQDRLSDNGSIRHLTAIGLFDDANTRLSATNLTVRIE